MTITTERYGAHGVAFKFSEKPSDRIRSALKANGFRWSPSEGIWWRLRHGEWADLYAAIQRLADPGKPDGECWICHAPGVFRRYGPATPVYCDACHKIEWEKRYGEQERRIAADDFDLANNRCM